MTPDTRDPVLRGLARLSAPEPGALRTKRVRQRCRKVLDERRRRRTSWKQQPPAAQAFDVVCLVAVGIYLAGAVSEAVRLGGFF